MIPRYSRPEMARLWSDENRFATWLEVEIAATEVLVERGVVPKEALLAIKERARFDVARIRSAVSHPGGPGQHLIPMPSPADGAITNHRARPKIAST